MSALDEVAARLGPDCQRDIPLAPFTTYGLGGPAALFYEARDEGDLLRVASAVAGLDVPILVVGRGSNLLVSDAGFSGLAITLGPGFGGITTTEATVTAGAAVTLPVLARRTAAAGLGGLEWAVGVPGSVGGAVRMNAGGHGSDIKATLLHARVVDLRSATVTDVAAADLDLSYRHSAVRAHHVVAASTFALEPADKAAAEARIAAIVRWRRQHQPGGSNAGSVFTNPVDDSAGRLVDAAGLKGLRRGSAYVSPKHANFFQVDDGGSADDVFALIVAVRERVREATGVVLVPELRLVGFPKL